MIGYLGSNIMWSRWDQKFC